MSVRPQFVLFPLSFLLVTAMVAGCGKPAGNTSKDKAKNAAASKDGPVVAYVGDAVITAAEVQAKLAEQSPFMQARYRDPKHLKDFVNTLVRSELLAQEAYRKGIDQQPEVKATIKKILVQEVIKQAFDEKNANYSDEELRAYYDKRIDDFVKPERVRAQHLFVAAPADNKAERAKAKAKAAELLARLRANEAKASEKHPQHATYSTTFFSELAREASQDAATAGAGGDLRYLAREELTRLHGQELADAVFALKENNQLTGIVETSKGFHIARRMQHQAAVSRTFDDAQVRETIRSRLFREQKTKAFDAFVEELKAAANVRIDEEVLAQVEPPSAAGSPTTLPPVPSQPPLPPVAGKPSPQ